MKMNLVLIHPSGAKKEAIDLPELPLPGDVICSIREGERRYIAVAQRVWNVQQDLAGNRTFDSVDLMALPAKPPSSIITMPEPRFIP